MNKIETAVNAFNNGFACSQAILSTFGEEYGLNKELALKIADPFGAGMRGLSQICGAVTGSFMVIGLKYGRTKADDLFSKEKTALLVEEFFMQFQERHGSLICQQLIGYNLSLPEDRKILEQKGIIEQKCPQFVRTAAAILEEILTY